MSLAAYLSRSRARLRRYQRDENAAIAVLTAIALPVLLGTVGLGTEFGALYLKSSSLQIAADAAALSAANALKAGSTDLTNQALAVATEHGFTNGQDNVVVSVRNPPTAGRVKGQTRAVEVTITASQPPLLTSLFRKTNYVITGRSVALAGVSGAGCIVALDTSDSGAFNAGGSSILKMPNCNAYVNSNSSEAASINGAAAVQLANLMVVGGVSGAPGIGKVATGVSPLKDPYGSVPMPAVGACLHTNYSVGKGNWTINPGVYCGNFTANAGANLTLNPGVYIFAGGSVRISGSASFVGTGVTLVFTTGSSGKYADMTIAGGANVSLKAPTSGPYAGIVIYADRNASETTFNLQGGGTQVLGGAVYVPTAQLSYAGSSVAGGSSTGDGCTQLIAGTVNFTGNSDVGSKCTGFGTSAISGNGTALME